MQTSKTDSCLLCRTPQTCHSGRGEGSAFCRGLRSLAGFFLILASTFAAAAPPAVSSADPHRYLDDIKALTTPAMEGRGNGTKGLTRARHLLEKRYKSLGLEPAGVNGSYLQPFSLITGAQLKGKNEFAVVAAGKKSDLKAKQDYVPFSFSSSGSAQGAIVFAGYGATADEFQYDDYAGSKSRTRSSSCCATSRRSLP